MARVYAVIIAGAVLAATCSAAQADDPKAEAILDKAIQALGGQEKLAKIEAFSWKSKVKFGAAGREMDAELIFKDLDHMRIAYGPNVVVLAGDTGWVKGGDVTREMSDQAIAFRKHSLYLQAIPIILLPIKRTDFKYEAAGEERVGDKPALGLKITGPDGKDFTLFFDKATGLPVKEVSQVHLSGNKGTTVQTTFSDYKDFGGIKKATRIESSGFGTGFSEIITDFQVLDKVDDGAFAKPK